jgi:RimJ/RimL family protein N-acetyltransferase
MTTPPYRIETERLVLRCWQPTDAIALKEAVDSSLEHLKPWMHWATGEPTSLDDTVALLRRFRGSFDTDQEFILGIFEPDESRVLGGTGLHTRQGAEALEIGYWLRADSEGKGLASEAAAVLTRVAFERCGVDRVEVRIDPANERSRRVPERLGFTHEATLRRRLPVKLGGGDLRDAVIFSMFASEFPASPCASVEYRAYDAAGRPLG